MTPQADPAQLLAVSRTQGPQWRAAGAAVSGSVGFMPIITLQLYAVGISAHSMLVWRYGLALVPLAAASALARHNLRAAFWGGAWRITLVGPTLGAGLITWPGLRGGSLDPRGLMWLLPSPLIYALYLAANAVLMRRHPPLTGAIFLYLGLIATFGGASLFLGLDLPVSLHTWMLLLIIALGPGALTVTLFSYSVPRLGPVSYAIIANCELVTVVLVGVLALGERLSGGRAIGAGLILSGIILHGISRNRHAR